tara:strand:- start:265 stop:666 length:402 start_codon:yes stop_codon:yes gene_type:complete
MNSSNEIGKMPVGHKFDSVEYTVSKEDVNNYILAIGNPSDFYYSGEISPPTALLAFALRTVMAEIHLPEGSIHVSQEMNCYAPIYNNDKVILSGSISQNSSRSGWRYLTFEISVESSGQVGLLSGKSTILVPE